MRTTRVLIVEDDPAVSGMLRMTFAAEGFESEIVTDGAAATARLGGDPVDIVVLDVMMPDRDGFSVLTDLRSRDAWTDTKVIVCTALTSDDDVWRGWSAGADYYLAKPFDLDHLRDVANRLVSGTPVI